MEYTGQCSAICTITDGETELSVSGDGVGVRYLKTEMQSGEEESILEGIVKMWLRSSSLVRKITCYFLVNVQCGWWLIL